jgi:excinuclease ABC subunit C
MIIYPNISEINHKKAPNFLQKVSQKTGIYIFYDSQKKILYVGKAKNLKNRLSSYFRSKVSTKTKALTKKIFRIETILTETEHEALLLESQLIKSNRPPYNILLRDDKSYPSLFISKERFPRIAIHRGTQTLPGYYFGPYTDAGSLHKSLQRLQKIFHLRACKFTDFKCQKRPCLQYQMGRCGAPCIGRCSEKEYKESVKLARLFLEGKNQEVIKKLITKMDVAAANQHYEEAAQYRDQIKALQALPVQPNFSPPGKNKNLDAIAIVQAYGIVVIQIMSIHAEKQVHSKTFFPKIPRTLQMDNQKTLSNILNAFMSQYYCRSASHTEQNPNTIFLNLIPSDATLIKKALAQQFQTKLQLKVFADPSKQKWLALAILNAKQALKQKLNNEISIKQKFMALQKALGLNKKPTLIHCIDVSHLMGRATVASCVSFGIHGPITSQYRQYHIKTTKKSLLHDTSPSSSRDLIASPKIPAGNDLAAMHHVLTRYCKKLYPQGIKRSHAPLPSILLLDGGQLQLNVAQKTFQQCGIESPPLLLGIAKGLKRKASFDKVYVADQTQALSLEAHSPALHLIQQIRDEAHRFAIKRHRRQLAKQTHQSSLEDIPNIGPKRRQMLLKHFGGLQRLLKASPSDIQKINGISKELAIHIHQHLHPVT